MYPGRSFFYGTLVRCHTGCLDDSGDDEEGDVGDYDMAKKYEKIISLHDFKLILHKEGHNEAISSVDKCE